MRSVASAVQGDFAQSLAFHPGGVVLVAALFATLAWDLAHLVFPFVSRSEHRFLAVLWQVTMALLVSGWILRLLAPASFLSIAP